MNKKKKRKINERKAMWPKKLNECPNCGEMTTGCYAPTFGFTCKAKEIALEELNNA